MNEKHKQQTLGLILKGSPETFNLFCQLVRLRWKFSGLKSCVCVTDVSARSWHQHRQVSGREKLVGELTAWESLLKVAGSAATQDFSPEPHTASPLRGTVMDTSGSGRDLSADGDGLARGEERSSGGRSELLMYLSCLPERYRTAKFSLAAYLLCWALVRWYQVRFGPHMLDWGSWSSPEVKLIFENIIIIHVLPNLLALLRIQKYTAWIILIPCSYSSPVICKNYFFQFLNHNLFKLCYHVIQTKNKM